jgi:hypothetical protein
MINMNGERARIRKGRASIIWKFHHSIRPEKGNAENIQDKNTAFRMWKISANVSEEGYASICRELFCPEGGQQAFPKRYSLCTELYDVTSGGLKETVQYSYFCLKQ